MFSLDKTYDTLDSCIDDALLESPDLFSIARLIRGQDVRPNKKQKIDDLRPITFVTFNSRLGKAKPIRLRALLDSGGSGSLICAKHTKHLRVRTTANSATTWTTPAGELSTKGTCTAQFRLSELHHDRVIEWKFHVAPDLGAYDIIIGRDMLTDLGIDVRFSDHTVHWDGAEMPLKSYDEGRLLDAFHVEEPPAVEETFDRSIAENSYEKTDLSKFTQAMKYLEQSQKDGLLNLLQKHESMFDGTLGTWKQAPYNIELRKDATPYHAKAFPVPRIHQTTMRNEVDRLVKAGVLKKVNRSEWAAPTYIIKKKNGAARFISDFRQLNARIRRKPHPIPKIQEMLQNLEGFAYATSIDLNMGYYHIELSPDAKKLCTIVLPWGKYEYQRLPMGLCNSPDIFQEKMNDLFAGMAEVRAYIDDLLVITNGSFEEHLAKLDVVLGRLRRAGLKVNAEKSKFCTGELEYLGYWITRDGIKPLPDKVHAIMKIAEPTNKKQLRGFIGIVNYYRDMWVRRSHILAPLARLTSKTVVWKWTEVESKAFHDMKKIICREVMLAFPDFSKPFVIHTDASHTQLGAVISQDGKPIAFYSRKLNPAQTRYTTTERELLSIVETLKEFRNILLGYKVIVYTDHKNLCCKNFNTERVMRWRLILEEYNPELKYIKGEENVVADALSRLDLDDAIPLPSVHEANAMAECFNNDGLEFPSQHYPLHMSTISHYQQQDKPLLKLIENNTLYSKKTFNSSDKVYTVIMFKTDRIVVPTKLQRRAVEWYHTTLMHPGETRTEATIAQHFYWKGLRNTVLRVCKACDTCQRTKVSTIKYGQLPPKPRPEIVPWHTLCIDLIGPYKVGEDITAMRKDKNGERKRVVIKKAPILWCLTMIDPATGWLEIVRIDDRSSGEAANELEINWFNRYPLPTEVVHDRGREFMGDVEKMMLNDYSIQKKPITTRNPQANSIVERCHQTIHNHLRTVQMHKKEFDELLDGFDGYLSAVSKAVNSTVHTTLNATPTQLVFGRDAFLPVAFEADWNYIADRKQRLIVQNNKRENAKRRPHIYNVGDQVMIRHDPNRKHGDDTFKGPYPLTKVNDNGTVQLRKTTAHGGAELSTWNIRNLRPYITA